MTAPPSMSVFIPLTIRKRNGRPKIVPPAMSATVATEAASPHVLRAIARAWAWRRKIEAGAASTILDIAQAEDVTDAYVSRMIRLAYLSPAVLEMLVVARIPPAVSIKDLASAAELPWAEQPETVFG